MKISEQITAMLRKRGLVLTAMEAMSNACVTKDGETESIRIFTLEEKTIFESHASEIKEIDAQLVQLRSMEAHLATQTAQVLPQSPLAPTPGVEVKAWKPAFPGQLFARYVGILARSKGNLQQAIEFSHQFKDTPQLEMIMRASQTEGHSRVPEWHISKAAVLAGTTVATNWALPLVEYNTMSNEFIEFLRPQTIIGQLKDKFRKVPFMTRMQRQTAGATAGWVGEGLSKPVSALAFDTVTMPWAKIAVIIVITQELARMSTPSAEQLIRDDMAKAIIEFEDNQLLDNTVTALAALRPASLTNGTPNIAGTGQTPTTVTNDVKAALLAMAAAKIPMARPVWIMSIATSLFLSMLRTAQDIFAFREELSRNQFFGIPVIVSNHLTQTDSLILMDAAEIFYADDGDIAIDSSAEATLQMDSAPATPPTPLVSLWQQNLLGIKAEHYVYWQKRRPEAVQEITGFPLLV